MASPAVTLRPTRLEDLRRFFVMQQDVEANRLAGTKPRAWDIFSVRWEEVLRDPFATSRAVVADGHVVGAINVLREREADWVGYWLERECWGRGIATRALALMLGEVSTRPLFARVAMHNRASRAVLERNGFAFVCSEHRPATDRFVECDVATLRFG